MRQINKQFEREAKELETARGEAKEAQNALDRLEEQIDGEAAKAEAAARREAVKSIAGALRVTNADQVAAAAGAKARAAFEGELESLREVVLEAYDRLSELQDSVGYDPSAVGKDYMEPDSFVVDEVD